MDFDDARSPSPAFSDETVMIPRGSREERAKRYDAIRGLLSELKGIADDFDNVGNPELDDDEEECTKENWKSFLPYNELTHGGNIATAPYPLGRSKSSSPVRIVQLGRRTAVEIWSEQLRAIFLEVVDVSFYSEVFIAADFLSIGPPWTVLFHELGRLKRAVDANEKLTEAERKASKALYYYATTDAPHAHFRDIQESIKSGTIMYMDIWALFRQGCHVATKDHLGNWLISRVVSVKLNRSKWAITTASIVRAGDQYHECFSKRELASYDGHKSIAELELCPLQYIEDHEAVEANAIARGKLWQQYCEAGPCAMSYAGRAVAMMQETNVFHDDGEVRHGIARIFDHSYLSADIMVDPHARSRFMKQTDIEELVANDLDVSETSSRRFEPLKRAKFSEGDYLRCPATQIVFDLDKSAWYSVNVESIVPRRWRPELFERVVMEPSRKQTLQRLVEQTQWPAVCRSHDAVAGKGAGLVLLFHGPSGTGKTMAAAALAEATRRPLLPVTPGYLGNHKRWERAVEQLFENAAAWNALLLVDEVEFTHERRSMEVKRKKSWLGALLQRLDHFPGVLILTTNRLHCVDDELGSRVSFALHFARLGLVARKRLWADFARRLDLPPARTADFLRRADAWSRADLDARQIRSVFNTATKLAAADHRALTADHIDHALDAARFFVQHRRGNFASALESLEPDIDEAEDDAENDAEDDAEIV